MRNFLDIKSLVEYLPLTKSTIYTMVNKGTIPYKKIGSKLIFDRDEIDRWVDNGGKMIRDEDIPVLLKNKKSRVKTYGNI